MQRMLFALAGLGVIGGPLMGEELPASLDKPFLGCWVGFAGSRDFEFQIGGDGDSELLFKKGKTRLITGGCSLKIYYTVEEQVSAKGGKKRWIVRTMQEDGFSDFDKETAEPETGKPLSFTATHTGGIKVKVTHVFNRGGVDISTKLMDKGAAKGTLRTGVRIVVGDMFRHIKDEDLEKRGTAAKLEESRAEVWPVGSRRSSGKKIKFEDYDTNLAELFPKGATKFALESDRIAGHEYEISTANPEFGTLEFRQTKQLIHGFDLHWRPDPAKQDEEDCRLVIRVK